MTTARSQLICPELTTFCHCISRCVRRSFLCGIDGYSGQSYEHRRAWVEAEMFKLATVYCIRICAYAIMSNHYHLVACIDKNTALKLSNKDVIRRWCRYHQTPPIIQRYIDNDPLSTSELTRCLEYIKTWRERLYSLSWFMKELNFTIAIQANREDQCTGHFWEGRFKSQALLGQKALIAAMMYVDLNPIRANIAKNLIDSDHTSIQLRLKAYEQGRSTKTILTKFKDEIPDNQEFTLPFLFKDYVELIHWSSRTIKDTHSKHMDRPKPQLMSQFSFSTPECLKMATELEKKPQLWVGEKEELQIAKQHFNKRRIVGFQIA